MDIQELRVITDAEDEIFRKTIESEQSKPKTKIESAPARKRKSRYNYYDSRRPISNDR